MRKDGFKRTKLTNEEIASQLYFGLQAIDKNTLAQPEDQSQATGHHNSP
jgi:hypothetical protein